MLIECKCGKEFITEADSHVVIPSPKGAVFNCGCFFSNEAQLEKAEKVLIREQSRHDRIESGVITNEMAMTQFKVDVEEYFQNKEQEDG